MPYERKKKRLSEGFSCSFSSHVFGAADNFWIMTVQFNGPVWWKVSVPFNVTMPKANGQAVQGFWANLVAVVGPSTGYYPRDCELSIVDCLDTTVVIKYQNCCPLQIFFFRSLRKQRNIFQLFKASKNLQPAAIRSKSLPFLWDSLSPDGWTICCVWVAEGVGGEKGP